MRTAQTRLIQTVGDRGHGVRWRQGTDVLNDPIIGAWCPNAHFEPLDLSSNHGSGTPSDLDIDLTRCTHPIELHLRDDIA